MKSIKQRSIALAATLEMAFMMVAVSAPSAKASSRYQIITGRVLKIDKKERQMLVADRSSKKLYLVRLAKEATFQITFGRNSQMSAATLNDVDPANAVLLRCARDEKEHLAKLDDGREVIVLTAAH
jgi:hypothetical protein